MSTANTYSMFSQWSVEDQAFLVVLPEWQDRLIGDAVTHGDTYEEAAKNGREALELLIESAQAYGEPLPAPRLFALASA